MKRYYVICKTAHWAQRDIAIDFRKKLTSKLSQGFSYDFMVQLPKMKSDIMGGVSQIQHRQ